MKQDLDENIFPRNLSYFEKILNQYCKGKTFFFGDMVYNHIILTLKGRLRNILIL